MLFVNFCLLALFCVQLSYKTALASEAEESAPTCSSSVGAESTVTAGTEVTLTCSVRYAGDYAPVMEWTDAFNTVMPDSVTTTKDGVVESTLTLTAEVPTVMSYTCKTNFNKQTETEPVHKSSWTSLPLHVTQAK